MAKLGDAEHWHISASEVQLLPDVVGQGGFGIVRRAIFCGMLVAVKSPLESMKSRCAGKLADLCNELRVLRYLKHPNIVATHGAIIDPQSLYVSLILEYIRGVTLAKFINKDSDDASSPGIEERYVIMVGICRALTYMHSRSPRIVHGDLKSSNIMVEVSDSGVQAKLLDFGLSRVVTRGTAPLGGTIAWMAPEVARMEGPTECSADVYSFGRLLAFVSTGLPPLGNMTARQATKALKRNAVPQAMWAPDNPFRPFLKGLVRACIRVEATRRPTIVDVQKELLRLPAMLGIRGESNSHFFETLAIVSEHMGAYMPEENTEALRPAEAVVRTLNLGHTLALAPPAQIPPAPLSGALSSELPPEPPSAPTDLASVSAMAVAVETEEVVLNDNSTTERVVQDAEPTPAPARLLLHPGKVPTEPKCMAVSLVEAITLWNFSVVTPPCCQIHGAAQMAQQLCGELLSRPCFDPMDCGFQCLNCGMFGYQKEREDCPLCRSWRVTDMTTGTTGRGGSTSTGPLSL